MRARCDERMNVRNLLATGLAIATAMSSTARAHELLPQGGAPPDGSLGRLLAEVPVAGDNFGIAVDIDGDSLLVGAFRRDTVIGMDAGSAIVFVRSGGGWVRQAELVPNESSADARLGRAVAISGDTAVVGAFRDGFSGFDDRGIAYVFVRAAGVWTQQARLLSDFSGENDHFGISVALDGDAAVVGANYDNPGPGFFTGSAYVFVRDGTTWTRQAALRASDGIAGDVFASSLAISADTVVVGAPGNTDTAAGAAYVFTREEGAWSETQKLTVGGSQGMGASIAISGDTLLIGASRDDTTATDAGAAHAFVFDGSDWILQETLLTGDGEAADNFGSSVALSGEHALVGAILDDTEAGEDSGSARFYLRSGTAWQEQPLLTTAQTSAGDYFGASVALSGDDFVIGAYQDDTAGDNNAGSAYAWIRDTIFADGFEAAARLGMP